MQKYELNSPYESFVLRREEQRLLRIEKARERMRQDPEYLANSRQMQRNNERYQHLQSSRSTKYKEIAKIRATEKAIKQDYEKLKKPADLDEIGNLDI